MRFDDFAREAGKAVTTAANHADRPPIDKVEDRNRRRNFGAVALAAAGIAVVAGVVALWLPQASPVVSDSAVTTVPTFVPSTVPASFAEFLEAGLGPQSGLIPESSGAGDRSVIDVTFTDGRRVQFIYPSDWPLDEYGWTPSTVIVYEPDAPRQGGSVKSAQLIFTYGTDDEWSIRLHQMAVWTDEELDLANSNVTLHKEANGFVTVTTSRPFSHYSRDPDQAPLSPDFNTQDPWIDVDDIFGISTTDTCIDDPEHPYPQREAHRITWCDGDAGVIITFTVPEAYHDEILSNVDVRLVTPAEQATRSTSTTLARTTTSLPTQFPAIRSDIGLGWEAVELPPTAAFCHQAVIPTDEEIVFWGGNRASCEYESPVGDPGLAYNPNTGTWRQLSHGPLEPAVAPTGVWTGSEVLICCGMAGIGPVGGGEIGSDQAAGYNPHSDSWRSLPDAPLGGPFPVSVWTGSEMVVATQSGVAAYHPSTNEWRAMPEAPQPLGRTNEIAWTGSEVIVWPSNVTRSVYQGMALDPDTGAWRILPDPPAWPAALDVAYTGDTLIIWGGLPAERGSERAVGSRLDLATNEWSELPEALPEPDGCECNLGSQTITWTGEYILVSTGFFGTGLNPTIPLLIAYDPDTNAWILVSEDSPAGLGDEAMLVEDRVVITENVITGSNRLLISPPGWQPTGEPMPSIESGDD